MQRLLLVAAVAASFALAACETKQDTGTLVGAVAGGVLGNQFGKGAGTRRGHDGRGRRRRYRRQRDRPVARCARSRAGPRGRDTTLGSAASLAGRCAGATPTTAATVRLSPTTITSAAAPAVATSCTRSGSTGARRPCAAPPAATPTAPGPRSPDPDIFRHRWNRLRPGPRPGLFTVPGTLAP